MTRALDMQQALRSRLSRVLVCAALALLATACSMASSTLMDADRKIGCKKQGGAYYLSRTYIKIIVDEYPDPYLKEETRKAGREKSAFIREITQSVKQDRRYPYCLDLLASPTSDDTFVVVRSSKLLLEKIASTADDKSVEIGRTLIKTLFAGLSHDPQFGEAPASRSLVRSQLSATKRVEIEYDPFDEDQAAVANDTLRDYGFCLVLESERFSKAGRSVNDYCDRPLQGLRREKHILKASAEREPDMPAAHTQGVYYRPRLPYNYLLLVKQNKQVRGGWDLRGSETVMLENGSPVFSVPVDRTFFAKRETILAFDEGVLQDVTIKKGSELLGFVQLPLAIAQSVAALPTSILQVKIDDTNNRHKLILAQSQLLAAHKDYAASAEAYAKLEQGLTAQQQQNVSISSGLLPGGPELGRNLQSFAGPAPPDRLRRCLDGCSGDDVLAPRCQAYCQCKVEQCRADDASCSNFCIGLLNGQ
ncbi:MAG: hypothetical protein SFW09_05625 [Hyphomicrobiaceae bacterium]|nr:hypothetical protein [Hyphomicrobiaceae bacterium]